MTVQFKDKLYYKGEYRALSQYLLEWHFDLHPEKRPSTSRRISSLWRGYLATFSLNEEGLHIKDISAPEDSNSPNTSGFKSVINEVFPGNRHMDWYSGLIRMDEHRFDNNLHPDFIYQFLEIRNGMLICEHRFDYNELLTFKKNQFETFRFTDRYKNILADWPRERDGYTDEKINNFLAENVLSYIEFLV